MAVVLSNFLLAVLFVTGGANAADAEDPYDLSFYTKGAAIGDSYAAGIGAGNQVDWSCSRYDGSYANMVASQLDVPEEALDFTYTACSGAVVKEITQQAEKLSSDQQFIMLSAGGNDANLVGILNSCVYSFWGGLSHKNCDDVLASSLATIKSDDFSSRLDGLIELAKSKLAADGKIYYTGYAKFWDTTDNTCDKVSWHIWLNLFTREYLTKDRRQSMNDLVDAMNDALRSAVERAGSQASFIDYDKYLDASSGRYCQPGQDEGAGKGANLPYAFFYQMKTDDQPWLAKDEKWEHDELKRRQDEGEDLGAANSTLGALFGAMIQEAIDQEYEDGTGDLYAALEDDNAGVDLDAEVEEVEEEDGKPASRLRVRSVNSHVSHQKFHQRFVRRADNTDSGFLTLNTTLVDNSATTNDNASQVTHALGSKVFHTSTNGSSFGVASVNAVERFSNTTSGPSSGTIIANSTHILLANNKAVSRVNIKKLFVSDDTSRVFHPTQIGHSMIANMILYQMAADNAKRNGIDDFQSFEMDDTIEGIGGAACNTDSSETWAERDAMISAVNEFCADPQNMKGHTGAMTSATYNSDSANYMNVSISWDDDANMGEHSCYAWLDTVTDACDTQTNGDGKHGGAITYKSPAVDATLKIEPLVMKRMWNKGQVGGQACNDVTSDNYMDQGTLSANIDDFCKQSVAQPNSIAESGSKFTQTFNDGRPDRVEISTEWPTGPRNYQVFEEECQYYLGVITNGCSLPDDSTNAMNWKHGGSITDNNSIKYTITPTQERPPPPSSPQGHCKARYWPSHWAWEVSGGGFSRGDTRAAIESNMRGCGAVTAFKFEYFDEPQEDGTEWKSSGTLPIIMSDHCVAKAVKSAGGFESRC